MALKIAPTEKHLAKLLELYRCADVVAPVDETAYSRRAGEVIARAAIALSQRRAVIGPNGRLLTFADLPPPNTRRWVVRRKAEVVAAVRGGLLSLEEACSRYALNFEEFRSWQRDIDSFGVKGLRTTRTQYYRRMDCPICGSDAEEIEKRMRDLVTLSCPHHGVFQFSATLRGEQPRKHRWELALARAKQRAKPGERPRVTAYDF